MALSPRLELRQSQSLVMTPQLQQAIKLLQLSNIELAAYVEDQVEKNPLLDVADPNSAESGLAADAGSPAPASEGEERTGPPELASTDDVIGSQVMSSDKQDAMDADYSSLYTDDSKADQQISHSEGATFTQDWSGAKGGSPSFDDDGYNIEATLSEQRTLREHLSEQLQMSGLTGTDRALGAYLIDCLDDAGYLTDDLDDIAVRLGTSRRAIEKVLAGLQQFDPAGVFCRSLSECLALQLRDLNRLDPAMEALLQNLDWLAKRDFKKLTELCGVGLEDVTDMVQEIRALNPKPGLVFAHEIAETMIPDVFVTQKPDGSWKIELNSDTLPKILLNHRYYAEISHATRDKDAKSYITDCYNEANWLVKSLDQRAKTILKVATEIVRQQDAFLVEGIHHLRPLNLKTVADAIGMHESTVSRVTSNKYMATERGVFEMKYFFTSAISSSDGESSHSAESVRYRIKKLIDEESPDGILSDDKIVEILRASDVDIARRTVAKYREAMKIPSSIQRRRLKKQMV